MAAISALMPAWVSSVVRFSGTDTRVDARTGVAQGHKVQLWKQDVMHYLDISTLSRKVEYFARFTQVLPFPVQSEKILKTG